jgi:hypothetical protein
MPLQIELTGTSTADRAATFAALLDLGGWTAYAGVSMSGPDRAVVVGDRVDVALDVGPVRIRCGMRVDVVDPDAGRVVVRTVDGPVNGEMVSWVEATDHGSAVTVAVTGVTRGPARLVERALETIARQWLQHQLTHLLARSIERAR